MPTAAPLIASDPPATLTRPVSIATAHAEAPAPPSNPPSAAGVDHAAAWQGVREAARASPFIEALLDKAVLSTLRDSPRGPIATVTVDSPASLGVAQSRAAWLQAELSKAVGFRVDVEFVVQRSTPAPEHPGKPSASSSSVAGYDHPLVRRAAELFDARLIAVERDDPGS